MCIALRATGETKLDDGSGGPLLSRSGELEATAMAKDERDILELFRDELKFIEQGGYGRSVRTPWQPKSAFQDSLTCINYADPDHTHPCNECRLVEFVSSEHQREAVPCHFIPLNETGETIDALELEDNEAKLEREVKDWLRKRIHEIEEERSNRPSLDRG